MDDPQLSRARRTGIYHGVGVYSDYLAPALRSLPVRALRGTSGGATMTYRSPGRFWFPHPHPTGVLLMYGTGRA